MSSERPIESPSSADLREHLAGADHFQLKLARILLTIEGLELLHDALHAEDVERPRLGG